MYDGFGVFGGPEKNILLFSYYFPHFPLSRWSDRTAVPSSTNQSGNNCTKTSHTLLFYHSTNGKEAFKIFHDKQKGSFIHYGRHKRSTQGRKRFETHSGTSSDRPLHGIREESGFDRKVLVWVMYDVHVCVYHYLHMGFHSATAVVSASVAMGCGVRLDNRHRRGRVYVMGCCDERRKINPWIHEINSRTTNTDDCSVNANAGRMDWRMEVCLPLCPTNETEFPLSLLLSSSGSCILTIIIVCLLFLRLAHWLVCRSQNPFPPTTNTIITDHQNKSQNNKTFNRNDSFITTQPRRIRDRPPSRSKLEWARSSRDGTRASWVWHRERSPDWPAPPIMPTGAVAFRHGASCPTANSSLKSSFWASNRREKQSETISNHKMNVKTNKLH